MNTQPAPLAPVAFEAPDIPDLRIAFACLCGGDFEDASLAEMVEFAQNRMAELAADSLDQEAADFEISLLAGLVDQALGGCANATFH